MMFSLVNSFADSDYAGTRRTSLAASFFAFVICYSGLEISNESGSGSGIFSADNFLISSHWLYGPLMAISLYALIRNAALLPDQKYLTIQEGKRTEEALKQMSGWESEAKSLRIQISELVKEIPEISNEINSLLEKDLAPDSNLCNRLLDVEPNVKEVAEVLKKYLISEEFKVRQIESKVLEKQHANLDNTIREIAQMCRDHRGDTHKMAIGVKEAVSRGLERQAALESTNTPVIIYDKEDQLRKKQAQLSKAAETISQFAHQTTSLSKKLSQAVSSIKKTYEKAQAVQQSQVIQEISEEIRNALKAQKRSILFNVNLPFAVTLIFFIFTLIYCASDFYGKVH